MKRGGQSSERHYILRRGREIFPAFKAPRQSPSFLLVKVFRIKGKVFGSEKRLNIRKWTSFFVQHED
jgi:hypothetical protein